MIGGASEAALGYGFAVLSAETGVGVAAGVAVGLHGTDVTYAGYYKMTYGKAQDTLTSQGLQALGVSQDWANGIDAGISMLGSMGAGAMIKATAGGPTAGVDDLLSASGRSAGNASSVSIQFGGNENQLYHTFRHSDKMGLDRKIVEQAIRNDISSASSLIVPGKPFIQVITVDGQKLQYNAYMLPNGTINVGRINGVP